MTTSPIAPKPSRSATVPEVSAAMGIKVVASAAAPSRGNAADD